MGRRRLALAIGVTEAARPLVALAVVAIFCGVAGLAFLASTQLSGGNAHALVVLLVGVFVLPYSAFTAQLFAALRRSRLSHRAARIDRHLGEVLHAHVEEVAGALGLPSPSAVWISGGFELSCVTSWSRYDLVLGLALMDVLSVAELRASIALLLARNFTGDPLTARAFRSIQRWFDVLLADPVATSAAARLAKLAALRCVEMLDPERIVEARDEQARAEAGRVAGDANVSACLLRASAYESYSNDVFWPGLLERHGANIEPPDGVSQHLAMCRSPLPPEEWDRRLNRAAAELKLPAPSAGERSRGSSTPSSDALLGALVPALIQAFDAAWRSSIAADWSKTREARTKRAAELAQLEKNAAERGLSVQQEWRRLVLLTDGGQPHESLRSYRAWLAAHPLDGEAHLRAGTAALATGDPEAIALLERAIELDPRHAAEATRAIAEELRAQGREADAEPYWERNRLALAELSAALEERVRAKPERPLLPHGLQPHEVDVIVQHLRGFPMIASAMLARRDVTIFPSIPCLALGVRFSSSWFWWNTEKVRTVLGAIADCPLPLQIVAQDLSGAKELSRAPAVEIYRAPRPRRREQLVRWGRRSQRVLIGVGGLFLLWAAIANRACFPECWTHANAILFLVAMIVALNLLVLGGAPDTAGRRALAFVASAFFAGYLYTNGWSGLLPFAILSLVRVPTARRPLSWAAGMSIPAAVMGWVVAQT